MLQSMELQSRTQLSLRTELNVLKFESQEQNEEYTIKLKIFKNNFPYFFFTSKKLHLTQDEGLF